MIVICNTQDRTQGFTLASQTLYHEATSPGFQVRYQIQLQITQFRINTNKQKILKINGFNYIKI